MDISKGTKRRFDIFALGCLIFSTSHLASRFDISSSFARPQFFAIAVIAITGVICAALSRLVSTGTGPGTAWPRAQELAENKHALATPGTIPFLKFNAQGPLRTPVRLLVNCANHAVAIIRRIPPPPPPVTILSFVVVCRVLLCWRVLRDIQCSWGWVQTLLPLSVLLADVLIPGTGSRIFLPYVRTSDDDEPKESPSSRNCNGSKYFRLRNAVPALAWALAASQMIMDWHRPTGVICPRRWRLEQYLPVAQVIGLVLDATFLVLIHRVRLSYGSDWTESTLSGFSQLTGSCWELLSRVFTISSIVLGAIVWIGAFGPYDAQVDDALDGPEKSDLVIDSCSAAVLLLSAIYLLSRIHPATIALVVSGFGVYMHRLTTTGFDAPWEHMESTTSTLFPAVMIISAGILVRWDRDLRPQPRSASPEGYVHRALLFGYFLMAGSVLYSSSMLQLADESAVQAIPGLSTIISSAYAESERWQARASTSNTLEEAAQTYRQRQGIPPPPNFDKWYEFAVSHKSVIIDDFAQIESDLLPFWGIEPAIIRNMTGQLLEYPRASMGGLRIQNGEIKLSPHIPGTHMWMVMGMADMIRPFAQWLPDMDLAINLDDECRAAVPFEERMALQADAEMARSRLAKVGSKSLLASFDSAGTSKPAWSDRYMEEGDLNDANAMPPFFADYHKKPIYRTLVAPACPPDSPARNWRWWNRKDTCLACAAPHTTLTIEGRVVSNWTGAQDICYQPDMAQLDGFIFSPAAMTTTQRMMPIFSQAKVTGFTDILIPSPWNFHSKSPYDKSADLSWHKKQNVVFWRGSASDGFAAAGSWTSFLRARFVDDADAVSLRVGLPQGESGVGVNVSFVGQFPRCELPDCFTESKHFYNNRRSVLGGEMADAREGKSSTEDVEKEERGSPSSVTFEEHWKFRHLIDLDGAGFSGRFLPFLQSQSLVYRAGLFRTWFDERVHPWRHYVPLDVRLGMGTDAWYSVASFFGGRRGLHIGEKIAIEGHEWAQKAARPVDMQVYLFRLLLEWGRIVDDRREVLGYVGAPVGTPGAKSDG